jgi:hypothetical protein
MKKSFLIFTGLIFVLALALPINALATDVAELVKVEQTDDTAAKAKDEGSSEEQDASTQDGSQDSEKKEGAEDAEQKKAE